MIGELDDLLRFGLIADFGAAEDDYYVRTDTLDSGDDVGGFGNVPDINAQADDLRILGEQDFRDVDRTLVDVEFYDARAGLERTEVREEIAQAERGGDEFRAW